MIKDEKHRTSARVVGYCTIVAVVIIMAVVITGCAPMTSNTVYVPVPVPCEIPDVLAPALPVDALAPDADVFTVVRALWASLERQEAHVERLTALLDGCRSK